MAAQGPAPIKKKRKRIPVEQYDRVSTMLVAMVPYPMIQTQLSKEWGKPKPYIMAIIRQVHEDWASDAAMVADTRRHQIRQAFETVYMKATQAKDGHLAARVLAELGKLDGAYAPTSANVNVSGGLGVGVGISLGSLGFKDPDEVRSRIDELRKRIADQGPRSLAAGQVMNVIEAQLAGEAPDTFAQAPECAPEEESGQGAEHVPGDGVGEEPDGHPAS